MLPHVIVHVAVSVDGRTVGFNPNLELYYGIASAFGEDATLTGADTLLAAELDAVTAEADDSPADTKQSERPLLVVTDSGGRVTSWAALVAAPYWRGVVVLHSERTPTAARAAAEAAGVVVWTVGQAHVDLAAALVFLRQRHGIRRVRVDSDGALSGALLRAGLVDELSVLVHPEIVGGTSAHTFFYETTTAAAARPLRLELVQKLGGGVVWLRYELDPG